MTILAATSWRNNAAMVEDLVTLGYLRKELSTLDPTYGGGTWWTTWQPDQLAYRSFPKLDPDFDFTDMPWETETFDRVVFDPPYVCKGGRETSGIKDFDQRYGLRDAPKTPVKLQDLIDDGLRECARVLIPGGLLLVKCQDYISSGRLWEGVYWTTEHACRTLGLDMIDHLYLVGHARPQPAGRRQVHARQNVSHLLVLEK